MSKHNVWGPILLAPALLLLIFLYLLPILYSVRLSFYDVGFVEDVWLGMENYRHLLSEGAYWMILRVTGKFLLIRLFATMILAYVLALGLSRFSDRFRGTLLTLFYLSVIFSGVVTVMAWRWLLRYPEGGLNRFLNNFGIPSVRWLGDPGLAPWVVATVMMGLVIGSVILLYVAAIGRVDQEMIEAARVDGANEWQVIRHIITPLTHRVRLYVLLISVIGALRTWEHPFFLTKGGPLESSTTMVLKIYRTALMEGDIGTACAMTTVTVLGILAMSALIIEYLREFLG